MGERLDAALLMQSYGTVDVIKVVTEMMPVIAVVVKKDSAESNRLKGDLNQQMLDEWKSKITIGSRAESDESYPEIPVAATSDEENSGSQRNRKNKNMQL
ncbi:MAG: hypothetical protein LQ350_007126 [Teloschistes chrysophthalmus]|nr:MAG: hypothetical protein LQ350_007126 [Niorma chrysophthalma]